MSYHYYLNGSLVHPSTPNAVPSVTTILSIRDKPYLRDWRDRVGPEEADKVSKKATDKGNAIHKQAELFFTTGEKQEDNILFNGLMNWVKKYNPIVVKVEGSVLSELHEYAGSIDFICIIDNDLWIIDFKSSKKIHQDYELQLAAYRQAYYEMTGKLARTAIVQLTDQINRGYRMKEMDGDFGVFMAHKEVYDYAVSIGEIKHPAPAWDGGLIY